ncbi:hypothetical protein HDV00_000430 [Rhizophlyctis rosea]|nr:hypothetical protein HDV00_000430 [Rhizophlyctis rosea]
MSNPLSINVNDLAPTLLLDIFEYIQPRSGPLVKVPRDVLEREAHDSEGNAPENRPYEVHLAQATPEGNSLGLSTFGISVKYRYDYRWQKPAQIIKDFLSVLEAAPLTHLSLTLQSTNYKSALIFATDVQWPLPDITQSTLTDLRLWGRECQQGMKFIPTVVLRNLTSLTLNISNIGWSGTKPVTPTTALQQMHNLKRLHILKIGEHGITPYSPEILLSLTKNLGSKNMLEDLALDVHGWDEEILRQALRELPQLKRVSVGITPFFLQDMSGANLEAISTELWARGVKEVSIYWY